MKRDWKRSVWGAAQWVVLWGVGTVVILEVVWDVWRRGRVEKHPQSKKSSID